MKCSKIVFAMCGVLTAYSMTGYSDPGQPKEEVTATQPEMMSKKLSVIVENYRADPMAPLNSRDVSDLSDYAAHSLEAGYDNLSFSTRSGLSQIINLNSDLFSKASVTKFNNDQKLQARMSTHDIEALKAIIVDIRDGKALTERQVSDVKDFKTMISRNAYAFIPELMILTQYVTINQGVFSSSDLDVFRQASRDAAGITATEMSSLNGIASRNNAVLNLEDVKVLKNLGSKASIGTLNGFSPAAIVAIYKIINDNNQMFPPSVVSKFNSSYNDNQAIQYYVGNPGSDGAKVRMTPQENGPSSAAQR